MGFRTTARAYASVSIGRYNDSIISSSPLTWIDTDPVFIIGNGTANNSRKNALIVYKNGNAMLEGELVRPSTGADKNLIPICYGSVSSTGTINSGTSNFSVTKTGVGQYEISISGESYSSSGYTTSTTALALTSPRMITTSASASSNLVIKVWEASAAPAIAIDSGFHFLVYKQ